MQQGIIVREETSNWLPSTRWAWKLLSASNIMGIEAAVFIYIHESVCEYKHIS